MSQAGPQEFSAAVRVGPFSVVDLKRAELTERVVQLALSVPARQTSVFALHVGGLNERRNHAFVRAMQDADVVYADGGSVVLLAKLAGASRIERAPTTDVGWDILRNMATALGRPTRIALLGGPAGLAERAGGVLEQGGDAVLVHADHGYHEDWVEPLRALREASPDVVVVGLGAPREMSWCHQHLDDLPTALLLTCGGWFGHLTGGEKRAPRILRRSGIEWIARLAQAPTRLGPRYVRGVWSTGVLAISTLLTRRTA